MKDIRLVATDLDHTLVTEAGLLPPQIHDYIGQLNAAGIVFVAASGRHLATLKGLFPPRGEGVAYISDNGGRVSLGDEILFESLLPRRDYQAMVRLTEERTPGVPIICGVEAAYAPVAYRQHDAALRVFYSELVFVEDLSGVDVAANKFTVYFPDGDARDYYDELYEPAYGADYSVTVGGPDWVDVMNRGVTKGAALDVLATHLGLAPEQLMAFGDTDNDLEMLDFAHHSYAVANADPEAQERARFSTDSNDEFGVLRVIEQLLDDQSSAS